MCAIAKYKENKWYNGKPLNPRQDKCLQFHIDFNNNVTYFHSKVLNSIQFVILTNNEILPKERSKPRQKQHNYVGTNI